MVLTQELIERVVRNNDSLFCEFTILTHPKAAVMVGSPGQAFALIAAIAAEIAIEAQEDAEEILPNLDRLIGELLGGTTFQPYQRGYLLSFTNVKYES